MTGKGGHNVCVQDEGRQVAGAPSNLTHQECFEDDFALKQGMVHTMLYVCVGGVDLGMDILNREDERIQWSMDVLCCPPV